MVGTGPAFLQLKDLSMRVRRIMAFGAGRNDIILLGSPQIILAQEVILFSLSMETLIVFRNLNLYSVSLRERRKEALDLQHIYSKMLGIVGIVYRALAMALITWLLEKVYQEHLDFSKITWLDEFIIIYIIINK